MFMMKYFLLSFLVSIIIIKLIVIISDKYKIFSRLDNKISSQTNISRLGGIAIAVGFLLPFILFLSNNGIINFNIILFFSGFVIIILTGLIDDLFELNAKLKLILHLSAALLLSLSGLSITEINIPGLIHLEFGYLSHLITMGLVVLFINAVNLIDGIDGLASGLLLIASFFILLMSLITGKYFLTIVSLIFIGSILGFMVFNLPPARILMGDCGSYSLGFIYSSITLIALKGSGGNITFLLFPVILLLIPIFDLINVVLRRYSLGVSIFSPDRSHIHHRLLDRGISKVGVLYILYSLTIILGLTSFLMIFVNELSILIFIISMLIVITMVFLLKSFEKNENIIYSPRFSNIHNIKS